MLKLTSRVAIVFLITTCWAIMLAGSGHCDGIVTGGLDALETGNSLGPNLLVNGDLRSGIQGWTLNPSCFSLEGSGDTASLRLQEPCAERYPVSKNAFKCPPGIYTISADIKTQTTITVPKGRGALEFVCGKAPPADGRRPSRLQVRATGLPRSKRTLRSPMEAPVPSSRELWDPSPEHPGSETFRCAASFLRRWKSFCCTRTIGE